MLAQLFPKALTRFVAMVPDTLAFCEYECRATSCTLEQLVTCERRARGFAGSAAERRPTLARHGDHSGNIQRQCPLPLGEVVKSGP
ncbi:hypothetical protein M2351_003683 [Azospirillum canadense]|nr:hypothetical protein [Azospirillum canadense]